MSSKLVIVFSLVMVLFHLSHGRSLNTEPLMDLEGKCDQFKCKKPYDKKFKESLSFDEQDHLLSVADKLTQIWGDTILEGDYEDYGSVILNKVDLIYKKTQPVAYLIHYSKPAIDTASRRFGKIAEWAFVSLDYQKYFVPEFGYAQFFL